MKLFVYGSLKPGGWSHHLLEGSVQNPREGTIRGRLYNAGSFPALRLNDTNNKVYGVVYDVNEAAKVALMQRLDILEGYPTLFDRTDDLHVRIGDVVEIATVYFGKDESLFSYPVIKSGIWEV